MNEKHAFDYERFLSLRGDDLVDYCEPLVNQPGANISPVARRRLQSELPKLDSEHAVYALELEASANPLGFVKGVIPFLADEDAAVCSAAFRCLERVGPDVLSSEILRQIASAPTVMLYARDVKTGRRIPVGTNEQLRQEFLNKVAHVSNR